MKTVIEFEDKGQDFLIFEINNKGKILDVQPFQFSVWSRFKVLNFDSLKIGGEVDLQHLTDKSKMTLKYKIEKLSAMQIEKAREKVSKKYGYKTWVDFLEDYKGVEHLKTYKKDIEKINKEVDDLCALTGN